MRRKPERKRPLPGEAGSSAEERQDLNHIPEFESSGSSPGRAQTERKAPTGCPLPEVPSSPLVHKESSTVQEAPHSGPATETAGVISPPVKKRGRPLKNGVAMTPAERKAASRANQKRKEQDAEREHLIAALMKQADFSEGIDKTWHLRELMKQSIEDLRERKDLISALMKIYRSEQGHIISRVEEHRRSARQQEKLYLRNLTGLSIEDLRVTWNGVSNPLDTRGRLPNERMSGQTGTEQLERIAAARVRNAYGRRVRAEGAGPD